jgi:hypothetical protein
MTQASLDDLKSLNRSLEIIFFPVLIGSVAILVTEMASGVFTFSMFVAGIVVMFSVLLSFLWISSMDKEEIVVLMKLKGDLFSLTKGNVTTRDKVWNFIRTSYRIVLYPTISLIMMQITFHHTVGIQYSFTEIILASIGLVTLFHFLPLQLRVQSLRGDSHTMINKANVSNVQSHLLLGETKIFKELCGEEYKLLLRTVTVNSEIIKSENKFLNNTESDPNITILRYILPITFSLLFSFPVGSVIKLIMRVL